MSPPPVTILWYRYDLRLEDNPALHAAIASRGAVLPVYIWDPAAEDDWPPGGASRVWLHRSLARLSESLRAAGSQLLIRRGDSLPALLELIQETAAVAVYWNRRYEPAIIQRDGRVKTALRERGVTAESFNSQLLFEPWTVQTKSGTPYKVFTPYYRACLQLAEPARPLSAPRTIPAPAQWPASSRLDDLGLLPRIPWDTGIRDHWDCGESGGGRMCDRFLSDGLGAYVDTRDRPDVDGTSRLSPYLRFGELSPRSLWHSVKEAMRSHPDERFHESAEGYLRQLVWREFAHHLLYHFPHTASAPLNERFADFPWEDDPSALAAWQQGRTGYPIVDAGMRQLWSIGWMHNRVRMLAGSFLVKDLLIQWQDGAQWFWDTLVDADLANNTLGWQWIAGCGADAVPFFRIFNPVTQGQKFDPQGDYVRRWIPELALLPDEWIHHPWKAPRSVLRDAGVTLGESYPHPLVDHAEARKRALERLRQ
jgi:deoxyribodipyrimidine photo-lyase